MRVVFVTVSDGFFFPGTVATVNSILHFHPEAHVRVINNHVQKAALTTEQREVLESAGAEIVDAGYLSKPGRKLAAWELKAYGAADLTEGEDVLVGVDSDCVLCGRIDDVIAEAIHSGKFLGGRDGRTHYDQSYQVYGIETPVMNEQYMSASLYVCALTEDNRRILNRWADCCDRAIFGGGGVYPGHGDQGVLNAVLYAERGENGVATLDNRLWSQHHCYWQEPLELRDGVLYNPAAQAPQRSIHCGGTEKFWTTRHLDRLEKSAPHVVNYAWYLALLWFGRGVVLPQHLENGHGHLSAGLTRYRYQVMEFLRALRPNG